MIKKDDFGGWPKVDSDRVIYAFCNFYMQFKNLKVCIVGACAVQGDIIC